MTKSKKIANKAVKKQDLAKSDKKEKLNGKINC
jgi:hypothetical protein